MNGHWKDYDYGVMVELMTPNQTNDLGITFEWNGVEKIWIQFWIPLPLHEIHIYWLFDGLNILYSYFENTVKFRCFCMGKYLFDWTPNHSDNVSKFWLKDENHDGFIKLSRWSNFKVDHFV